jgi:Zn-dependent metalloprotease
MQKTALAKPFFFLGALAIFVNVGACSDESDPPLFTRVPGGIADLETVTGTTWLVRNEKSSGRSEFAKPSKSLAPLTGDPVAASAAFLAQFPAVFGVLKGADLEGTLQEPELDGTNTIRFQQRVGPRFARDVSVTVYLTSAGAIDFIMGSAVPEFTNLVTELPTLIQAAAATEIALKAKPGQVATEAELYADSGRSKGSIKPRWIYQVRMGSVMVVIDARSGMLMDEFSLVDSALTPKGMTSVISPGVGGKRTIDVSKYLDDAKKPVYQMWNQGTYLYKVGFPGADGPVSVPVTSDAKAWNEDPEASADAVEVYFNLKRVLTFMDVNLKWSLQEQSKKAGKDLLSVSVRANCSGGNGFAYWSNNLITMCVPGSRPLINTNDTTANASHSLDFLAHEAFHLVTGLVAKDSSLSWKTTRDGGALSEGLSDVFGEFTSYVYQDGSPAVNFDGTTTNRSWIDPHATDVETVSADDMDDLGDEPHASSTLITQPWYLMTFGGRHAKSKLDIWDSLSVADSEALWWETTKKALGPDVTISKFASAQMEIAKKRKLNLETVGCAWTAVKAISKDDLKKLWGVTCDNTWSCKGREDGFHCFSDNGKPIKVKCAKGKEAERVKCAKVCYAQLVPNPQDICEVVQ